MSDILVAYFSASGVTAKTAKALAQAAGADLYEIKPQIPYSAQDLNWNDASSRSSVEMRDTSFRPALADHDAPIKEHKTIFLGFPIWWYIAPTIINTFLEAYDFADKKIILFATSGGSGFGKALQGLAKSAPKATLTEGKVFRANDGEAELAAWVKSLSL